MLLHRKDNPFKKKCTPSVKVLKRILEIKGLTIGKGLKIWNLRNQCKQSNSWGENGDNEERSGMWRLNYKGKRKHNKKIKVSGKKKKETKFPQPQARCI